MIDFLSGAVMMASAACGLFFLKSWRNTRDPLFFYFALAFWAMAIERWVFALVLPDSEYRFWVYGIRMIAFVLIAWAIVDKNRKSDRG